MRYLTLDLGQPDDRREATSGSTVRDAIALIWCNLVRLGLILDTTDGIIWLLGLLGLLAHLAGLAL